MGRVNRRARLALGAGVIAIAGAVFGVAGSAVLARAPASVVQKTPAVATATFSKETLKATYVEDGNSPQAEAAGTFLAIDPLHTITCGATSGHFCTVQVNMSIQVSSSAGAGNRLGFPWQIDGVYKGLGGPYAGETASDGSFSEFSYSDFQRGVTPGSHTVQAFAYSFNGLAVSDWSITYQVFQP